MKEAQAKLNLNKAFTTSQGGKKGVTTEASGFSRSTEVALAKEATSVYLEPIAKSYKIYSECGYWSIVGECLNGHKFAKKLGCGREWCPECRDDFHMRRLGRWLPKARQIGVMGYLVITTPESNRPRSKQEFYRIRKAIYRGLKRLGIERGLSRWHWFGDKEPRGWYPHLNLLLDFGFMDGSKLQRIKRLVGKVLGTDMVVVNYRYTRNVKKMLHWLRYVTRATFLESSWDKEMAEEIYHFNNCHCFGSWEDKPRWDIPLTLGKLTEISHLEDGFCPYCHSPIEWFGGISALERSHNLEALGYQKIGGGYYSIPP